MLNILELKYARLKIYKMSYANKFSIELNLSRTYPKLPDINVLHQIISISTTVVKTKLSSERQL